MFTCFPVTNIPKLFFFCIAMQNKLTEVFINKRVMLCYEVFLEHLASVMLIKKFPIAV